MAFVAFIFGLLLAAVGTVGVVAPSTLIALALWFQGPLGLGVSAAARVLFGTALFLAAPRSRAPWVFRALGVALAFIGLLMPLMGVERYDALLAWWATERALTVRLWGACAAIFGGLTAYGIMPRDAR